MSKRLGARGGRWVGAAALALILLAPLGVVGSATARSGMGCGTVVINEQAWAGSTANTYVAKAALQKIGCNVKITQITEIPVYQAMADGKTDAVLEDWQHVDQYKQYVSKQHTAVLEGSNGVNGHIGWYIPDYLMKAHPEFKTWKGLKGKESIFKSPESGSQGMFLGGDPSYVQKDALLIQALGLNLKFVSVGAEPAQVARWTQLVKQHKPVLLYWYTPQYLNVQYHLVEVKLPKRFAGCQDNAKSGSDPKKFACAYDTYPLNKVFSAKFAKSGSPAVGVLKRFSWTNDDQNLVAKYIAGDHMNPDDAAKKWIAANQATFNKWVKG